MLKDSRDIADLKDRGDMTGEQAELTSKLLEAKKEDENALRKQLWFWPYTTRDEAERVLAGQPDGTFLVRDCSVPGDFTLTVRQAGGSRRIRIYKHQTGYSLSPAEPDAPFPSPQELVEFYRHHSLATFNKRLDVCLSRPLAKPASAGTSQYGVFKELYDLSQVQLSAHTRHSILLQQRSQLHERVRLFKLMLPALRVVQQMYFESMQLQEESTPKPSAPSMAEDEGTGPPEDADEYSRLRDDLDDAEGEGRGGRLSKEEEKSFTVNTRLLLSRHSAMSNKLHCLKSNYDVDSIKLQDLDSELKHIELTLLHMKRRREELIRQMTDRGCRKEYLSQVLESRVATREFDRSTWLRDCSRDEALAQLEGLPHGAFLVRRKDQRHLPFVLSIVISGDGGPRTVQHCYIVRPHGRGYGFNAALAVFESIDQLVLRHRCVSLQHYFKGLDVMLTFPVGCQELLHRSLSESDQESMTVNKGEYANAAAVQEAMVDSVYEPVDFPEAGKGSADVKDLTTGNQHTSGGGPSGNGRSGPVAAVQGFVKKNDYEVVDSSKRHGAYSKSAADFALVKEHNYEYVGAPAPSAGDDRITDNQRKVKEVKYEPIGLPGASADATDDSDHYGYAKYHRYETVSVGNSVEPATDARGKNPSKQHEENIYESVATRIRHTTV